jgi:hypothetical protein
MAQQPIFILTCRRSGSTLLRVMLAGHPGLFAPPELNLAGYQTMRQREDALGPCQSGLCKKHSCDQREGLQRAIMELQQIDDAASQQVIHAILERNDAIKQVYDELIRMASPRRLVDKSPLYPARYETLQRTAELFPNAQYVHIHRHPYAVIQSLLRNGFESSETKAAESWTTSNDNIRRFLLNVDPKRQMGVPYEALVRRSERVMRELCSFLDIEFHAALLNPYDGSRMTDGVRPGSRPPGDGNFSSHKAIDPKLGTIWQEFVPEQPPGKETLRVSSELGYDLQIATKA